VGKLLFLLRCESGLGIQSGGILTLEEKDNVVVLRPAAVVEIEAFSDEEIARWIKKTVLNLAERNALFKAPEEAIFDSPIA